MLGRRIEPTISWAIFLTLPDYVTFVVLAGLLLWTTKKWGVRVRKFHFKKVECMSSRIQNQTCYFYRNTARAKFSWVSCGSQNANSKISCLEAIDVFLLELYNEIRIFFVYGPIRGLESKKLHYQLLKICSKNPVRVLS